MTVYSAVVCTYYLVSIVVLELMEKAVKLYDTPATAAATAAAAAAALTHSLSLASSRSSAAQHVLSRESRNGPGVAVQLYCLTAIAAASSRLTRVLPVKPVANSSATVSTVGLSG